MDYVDWCDEICKMAADHAEAGMNPRHLDLWPFSDEVLNRFGTAITDTARFVVFGVVQDVSGAFGIGSAVHTSYGFTQKDLDVLRSPYARWKAAMEIELDDLSIALLQAIANATIRREGDEHFSIGEVSIQSLMKDPTIRYRGEQLTREHAFEVLDALRSKQMINEHSTLSTADYSIRYCGAARLSRAIVIADEAIDELRSQGEGDALDYKRELTLNSPTQKLDFVRDVTAMANAGGAGPRHLLVGVEDSGEFHIPPADKVDAHRSAVLQINDATLQQIVGSRTTHSPSVRVSGRGEHRQGPYALIEIRRDIGHRPYRVYPETSDRSRSDAHQHGEVWIRKGSTKQMATDEEIKSLERLADQYRSITMRPGED